MSYVESLSRFRSTRPRRASNLSEQLAHPSEAALWLALSYPAMFAFTLAAVIWLARTSF